MRDIRGSGNHTSKSVKRGGFFGEGLIFVGISKKVSLNVTSMQPTNSSINSLLMYEF